MSEFEGNGGGDRAGEGQPQPDTPSPSPAPALREDQLQNSVAFLSHPKVRASTVASKREFLQRKGLTEAEIDEAFRRVPQQASPPALPAAPVAPAVQSTLQHLQPQQHAQPAALAPGQQQQQAYAQQPYGQQQYGQQQAGPYGPGAMVAVPQHPEQQGVRWTQAVLGAGFLAASAYAAKALVWPYMEGAYHSWRGHVRPPPRTPLLTDGDGDHSAHATQAMADAIAAQTSELRSSIESIKQLVAVLEANQKAGAAAAAEEGGGAPADGGLTVSELRQELRSFADTLHELASPARTAPAAAAPQLESELGEIKTLLSELLRSPRSSISHSPARPLPGSKAGEAGSGADVATPFSAASSQPQRSAANGASVPAGTPASEPTASAAALPAGTPNGDAHQPPAANSMGQHDGEEAQEEQQTPPRSQQTAAPAAAAPSPGAQTPQAPPHPASYLEVLEMLEKGQTPPGIRTDINDKPPDPSVQPAAAKLKPRPKPWERDSASASLAGSLAGGAGGSSSSLGSLGGGAAAPRPAPASPAGLVDTFPAAAPAASGSAEVAANGGAQAGAASPAAQQGLSPVRAPSPAEEVQVENGAAAAGAPPDAGEAEGQQGPPSGPGGVAGGSLRSPKRAASIYDAVAPGPDSPHIIAGRLSPSRRDSLNRTGSGTSLDASLAGAGAGGTAAPGGGGNFAALLAAAKDRANGAGSVGASQEGPLVPAPLEGSGIGRPISRNWRPPPIPAPTIRASSSAAPPASGSEAAAAAPPGSSAGGAVEQAGSSGAAGSGTRVASAASLGEDFASA